MKKVIDQTVRDLKREVNKKVLKVPGIEQKVLDATSNEPWGPHGTLLADIAQASRNYHEYQMIMTIVWKRINDTGKNWRHVYKALTVLEYMVANGSERAIDEIKEHVYQIQTLSNFQYIDSSGRDQGNNVRRKSQSLVALVNDKERIAEVRQKAAANRDKFRSASSAGGMYRPGSYPDARYADEGQYGGGRDDDKYDYGRDRDWGSKDGDSNRDGDRYGRESEERYGRGSYKDDEYRGRSRSTDNYQYGSRSRSSDRERERAYEDDGNYSSRDSGTRVEESLEQRLERKFSEQNLAAPPSYEEAVSESRSPGLTESENQAAPVPKPSPAPVSNNTVPQANAPRAFASPPQQEFETFDEFDPRIPVSAPPATSVSPEVDLFGSDSFNQLALALVDPPTTYEVDPPSAGPTFSSVTQAFDDPFGDGPFKANPSTNVLTPAQTASFQSTATQPTAETVPDYGFAQSPLSDLTYTPTNGNYSTAPSGFPPQSMSAPNPNTDMYGGGLPPSASPPSYHLQPGSQIPPHMQPPGLSHGHYNQGSFQQQGSVNSQVASSYQAPNYGSSVSQAGPGPSMSFMTSQPALTASSGALTLVPQQQQPSKDKFETKSTVWADTLSRGLVNLNISGSKANPLADIGVDFDALNRKERRMEKPTANPSVSTITMGKAMGSGSGMGRGGAIRPPSNPSMGMGGAPVYRAMAQPPMGLGMGMNPGMAQGGQMQRPGGGYTYTPMMGPGGGYTQQPYGGYR